MKKYIMEQITHPDKILFPKSGITKREIARYYKRIFSYMIPYIKERPLTLKRFTEGIAKEGFYQKHVPDYFPEFITRIEVPMESKSGEKMQMVGVDEAEDLVYLSSQNVIELHMALARAANPDRPDQVVFDLDPSDNDFSKVKKTAFAIRDALDEREIMSFLKTTGSRGLHIHIPVKQETIFDRVKGFAKRFAESIQSGSPGLVTLEHRRANRGNKVFIDYLRNDNGMTAIAPYSLRALPGAPIATPITWEELRSGEMEPQRYTISNIFRRLGQKEDPWKEFYHNQADPEQLVA